MKRLNVVYAHMRKERFQLLLNDIDLTVIWTRQEEPKHDIVLYLNGYSYHSNRALLNPDAFRILYMFEPIVVWPKQYTSTFWKPFDAILTWNKPLSDQGGKFRAFPHVNYDFPFGAVHGHIREPAIPEDWHKKRKAIVQVAGNKYSLMPSELYSRRRAVAKWFNRHGKLALETFGVPAMPVPGYKGRAANKMDTLSTYRFALCLENDAHPIWSQGYITEKIFDCLYAFTVPIYLGAADIHHIIPENCYIDLRRFDSLADLDDFLHEISDSDYLDCLRAIETFLLDYEAPAKHSCQALYRIAIELATDHPTSTRDRYFGFWEQSSLDEKIRYLLMSTAVSLYHRYWGSRYAGTD
jgi:hypothetical protein